MSAAELFTVTHRCGDCSATDKFMRLLVITQKMDRADTVLGFMHAWIAAWAGAFPRITVICLEAGAYSVPKNVQVFSLGKERMRLRLLYAFKFLYHMIAHHTSYDEVLVHMNPEYVLLGWWWWKLTGKKVVLWYNHPQGSLAARLAFHLVDRVVCTSPFAYAMRRTGTVRMPVGVDTKLFRAVAPSQQRRVVYVGRISPVKKIELLIAAARQLRDRGVPFELHVYGDPTDADGAYAQKIHEHTGTLAAFHSGVLHEQLPQIFSAAHVVVNMTPIGSYDKTILEAMACERLVLVSNRALEGVIPNECLFTEGDADALARGLQTLLGYSAEECERIGAAQRAYVEQQQSLSVLTQKLHALFVQLRERL